MRLWIFSILLLAGCTTATIEPIDQPTPYTETINWTEYGFAMLYPSVIRDIQDTTGYTFNRRESGRDRLYLIGLGGHVWNYGDTGAIGTYHRSAYCWVAWHEIGHTVANAQKKQLNAFCQDKRRLAEPATSRYAMTNCHEDFAESYAAYKLGGPLSESREEHARRMDLFANNSLLECET